MFIIPNIITWIYSGNLCVEMHIFIFSIPTFWIYRYKDGSNLVYKRVKTPAADFSSLDFN